MGETAAETMKEIEATRDRLDGEPRQLEDRSPAAAKVANSGGAAAGHRAWGWRRGSPSAGEEGR